MSVCVRTVCPCVAEQLLTRHQRGCVLFSCLFNGACNTALPFGMASGDCSFTRDFAERQEEETRIDRDSLAEEVP